MYCVSRSTDFFWIVSIFSSNLYGGTLDISLLGSTLMGVIDKRGKEAGKVFTAESYMYIMFIYFLM